MHGIVTLLPQPIYKKVEQIWDELEANHGLIGIRVTPFPHFSWTIGAEFDIELLQPALQTVAARTSPLTVTTTGLSIFTGPSPVIFIPVVKTKELIRIHQEIFAALRESSHGLSPLYNQQNWVPHISLAYMDVTSVNIGAVMQNLAFRSFNWEFQVDNFTFISEPEGMVGLVKFSVPFGGPITPLL